MKKIISESFYIYKNNLPVFLGYSLFNFLVTCIFFIILYQGIFLNTNNFSSSYLAIIFFLAIISMIVFLASGVSLVKNVIYYKTEQEKKMKFDLVRNFPTILGKTIIVYLLFGLSISVPLAYLGFIQVGSALSFTSGIFFVFLFFIAFFIYLILFLVGGQLYLPYIVYNHDKNPGKIFISILKIAKKHFGILTKYGAFFGIISFILNQFFTMIFGVQDQQTIMSSIQGISSYDNFDLGINLIYYTIIIIAIQIFVLSPIKLITMTLIYLKLKQDENAVQSIKTELDISNNKQVSENNFTTE